MRIKEIEQYFNSDDTLDQVLESCKEDFGKIDYWSDLMRRNITDNPEEVKKAINVLTGVFMNLKPVLAVAETQKKNREIRCYDQLRIDTENEGKKFVNASAEKQASVVVSDYRRVRNVIQAYVDAGEKAISTLQSTLKYMSTEMTVLGREEKE